MGIKGLKTVIKEYFKPVNFKELKGSKICIDTSIFMYKFRYVFDTDDFHILGFLHKTIELLELGLVPVFVFDGKPPDAKKDVLKKRSEQKNKLKERISILRETIDETIDDGIEGEAVEIKTLEQITKLEKNLMNINPSHYSDIKELLGYIGIPFYESVSEAEETCAVLQKKGLVDYILTEDTDVLTFGGSNVIFKNGTNYSLAVLEDILTGLDFSYHEFIDFCILCGCDYTCTVPKVGPITALKFIREFKRIEDIDFKKFVVPSSFDYQLARSLFVQNEEYTLSVSSFEINKLNLNGLTSFLVRWNISEIEQIISKLINLL